MAGAKGYRTVIPLMVGIIAGEVAVALLWSLAGVVVYLITGKPPTIYEIFPG